MKQFHKRVSIRGKDNWKKLKTLHGFLTSSQAATKGELTGTESSFHERMEATVDAIEDLGADASKYGNMDFYTPEVHQNAKQP